VEHNSYISVGANLVCFLVEDREASISAANQRAASDPLSLFGIPATSCTRTLVILGQRLAATLREQHSLAERETG
jgi:hypothetical protein